MSTSSNLPTVAPFNGDFKEKELPKRIYEVFLSFRGEDTRTSFTSHLHAALRNAAINVFIDDRSLQRGDQISDSLLRAIEESRISIIVFSTNYAGSKWCLQELVKIMECHRTIDQIVLPVFYNVDPSDVRHQTSEFGNAFQNLVRYLGPSISEQAITWIHALTVAASLAGFVIPNIRNENVATKNIVEKVTRLLDKTDLFITQNPVGVESRVQDMIQLLDLNQQSNDVRLLGMWGMGGAGKTTIAKEIYNKIGREFEGRSFLANIREVWEQSIGQVHLQEQLLFDICKEMQPKIQNIEAGKILLKDRPHHRKVLLVIDDVNTLDQLNALCGSRQWFGSGSRIIITTRDKNILGGSRVDHVYTMEKLNESESIELFSWHAFKQKSPREKFVGISRNVAEYSGGLPLALEVLGSHLYNRGVTEWKCVLEKLKRIPNVQVHKKLKISYDGLNDDIEKEIFLDISCFFIGMDRNDVIHILNGCELYAEIGISVLIERSLVTVDDKNRLGMHDLLRDMGREIIREKSPKEPGKSSRLWLDTDVLDVLSEQTGTRAVEGLTLKLPRANGKCFSTKAFKKMKRLRLLQLSGVQLDGNFKNLSKNLRWLSWNGFPLTSIPTSFYQKNLVALKLKNSNIELVWKETQRLEKLKILNLSHSHYLKQSPDFSNLPNLEKLVLKDCPRLSDVSPTIGHLNKILLINLEDCISLCSLPRSFYKLKSLKTLILSGCPLIDKLEALEEIAKQLSSLTSLIANTVRFLRWSSMKLPKLPYIDCISLESLEVSNQMSSSCGYEGFSRNVFRSIIWSLMSLTNNLLPRFQPYVAMSSLVLDVQSSRSYELSSIIKCLPSLQSLSVGCSSELQLSRHFAIILDALYATTFKELESTATSSQLSNIKSSALIQCFSQVHISCSKSFLKSLLIQMGMSCQITNILVVNILQNITTNGCDGCMLPGDNYPDWLIFSSKDSSVIFEVPHVEGRNLKTIMCSVYSSTPDNITSDGLKYVVVKNYTKATFQIYKRGTLTFFQNEEGERVVSSLEHGDKVEVVVAFEKGFTVNKIAVYLVYNVPIGEKVEQCHAPDKSVAVL